MRSTGIGAAVVLGGLLGAAGQYKDAHADRSEAQWSARPLVGAALLKEEGSTATERAMTGGLSLGLSYGLSNRLDLGVELTTLAAQTVTFPKTMVDVDGGRPMQGPMTRQAGTALLLLGPTWRFGFSWVPVVTLAAGGGVRYRSAGMFIEDGVAPGEKAATAALDLAATARVGLEHRMNRRLVAGVYASGLVAWSSSAPLLPPALLSVGLSYVHYPLW
jgi:hypothetical protein